MERLLLILLFALQATTSYSQSNDLLSVTVTFSDGKQKEGYIPADKLEKYTHINFKEEPAAAFSQIKPEEVRSIESINGFHILTHTLNGKEYFLEALVTGEANLFLVEDETGSSRFFALVEENQFQELTEKKTVKVIEGKTFSNSSKVYLGILEVLFNDCRPEKLEKTRLSYNSLTKAFTDYNECKGNLTYASTVREKGELRLTFLGGININQVDPKISSLADNFDSQTGLSAGLEISYIPSFFSSRIEGALGIFYSEKGGNGNYVLSNYQTAEFDYRLLEVTLSTRYYLLKSTSRLNPYLGLNINKGFLTNKESAALKYNEEGEKFYLYKGSFTELGNGTAFYLGYEAGLNYTLADQNGLKMRASYYAHHDGIKMFQFSGLTLQAGYYFSF